MKLLNKLALATAVAALSTASFAMEAMTDDSMAATTGQDGINLQINTSAAVTADSVLIHDNDGFAGAADAGAIILNGLSITGTGAGAPGTSISADIDAGSNGGAATLQIAATLGAATVAFDGIQVGTSGTYDAATNSRGATAPVDILGPVSIGFGDITANIQLGNEIQGDMIALSSNIAGGISLEAQLIDNDGGVAGNQGNIDLGTIRVTDVDSANLTLNAGVNVDGSTGLEISTDATARDIYITDFGFNTGLGNPTTIGDIEVSNLSAGITTISVQGK